MANPMWYQHGFKRPDYLDFLAGKRVTVEATGFEIAESDLNPLMFPHQKAIARWTILLGRAMQSFANVGLGKTFIYLEYAPDHGAYTGKPALILVPLAVAPQTIREGQKYGIEVTRRARLRTMLTAQGFTSRTMTGRTCSTRRNLAQSSGRAASSSTTLKSSSA
jgi:hypothetical protein